MDLFQWVFSLIMVCVCVQDCTGAAFGRIIIELSCFNFLRASCISFVMLGLGGSACWRMLLTDLLALSACSESSILMVDSTLATISVAGMLVGVTVKFNPITSNDTSASLRGRDGKLIIHLIFLSTRGVWSTWGVLETEACFSCTSFRNLRCCRSFVAVNTLWVLTLIFSSISLASSAVRVAVMPLVVDSVSLFASPLAL